MKKKPLVAVAMSGGVDSSVAALLLQKQGYQIVGLTMQLVDCGQEKISGCCGIEAVRAAQQVCAKLNIPHYVVNFRQQFKKQVVDNFIKEYQIGHTPNPCVICNEKIKFDLLLERARQIGAGYLATGHYAQLRQKDSKFLLLKGKDKNKDQSYFLYRLNQAQLKHLLFPLGNLTKPDVRRIALKNNLNTAKRPESQEICFIPDNNYRRFLLTKGLINKPGVIVDKNKKVLGQHSGLFNYTIGQRKGLKISSHQPLYVIRIDVKKNQIIVGSNKDLLSKKCLIKDVSWIEGIAPAKSVNLSAKIRYRSLATKVIVKKVGTNFICCFVKSQRAITPGQSIVFYTGQKVLGGGIIEDLD